MDYIIDLYGVKDSTMSYSKCAMPSLSCLLSFYTIPISLFFNLKNFYFLVIPMDPPKISGTSGKNHFYKMNDDVGMAGLYNIAKYEMSQEQKHPPAIY